MAYAERPSVMHFARLIVRPVFVALLLLVVPALHAQEPALPKDPPAPPVAAANPTSTEHATASGAPVLPPLAQAQLLFRQGKYGAAVVQYQAVIQSTPGDAAAAHAGLARAYLAQLKMSEALASANEAVKLAPALPVGHTALGDIYFRQAKLSDAEREYLTPIRAGIPDARAYYGLSQIARFASSTKRAKHMIDKAYALDPADTEIFRDWVATLDLAERVRVIRERMTSSQPDSDADRSGMKFISDVFDAEAKQPNHSCHLVNRSPTVLPLERLMLDPRRYRGYGLAVKVNGASAKLMLDTGATGILVSSKIAEKAGARRIAGRPIGGIGDKGDADGYIAYVDNIKIGDLEFQGCLIDVVDKKRSLGEDGLIGADVFQSFMVDIDFPDEQLKLTELPVPPGEDPAEAAVVTSLNPEQILHDRYIAPEMKDYERIFRSGHDLLIKTYVNTTVPRIFLIDTGSYDNLLSTSIAREYTNVHNDDNSVIKGLSGKVKDVYVADKVKIAFAHFMQDNEDVTAFDLTGISNDTGTEVSGLLGFSLLWLLDIKIDYRDGLINFTHDPNRLRN